MAQEWILKKETEGLILAVEEQALTANSIKHSVNKTSETPLCRLCGESIETAWHIVSGCMKLVQNEYRKCHQGGPAFTLGDVQEIWDRVY